MTNWLTKTCTECDAPLPCTAHGQSLFLPEARLADGTTKRLAWELCGPETMEVRERGKKGASTVITCRINMVAPDTYAYVEEARRGEQL